MSTTRAFSSTTCRVRRHSSSSPSRARASWSPATSMSRSASTPSRSGGRLAGGAAVAVGAVGVAVVHPRVDHQQSQTVGRRVERHLLGLEGAVVEEQRVAGGATQRRELVHHARSGRRRSRSRPCSDRRPRLLASRPSSNRSFRASAIGALERVRGRQPAAQRHPAVDEQVHAAHRVAGLARRPHHAGDVGRPAVRLARLDVGQVDRHVAGVLLHRAHPQYAVVAHPGGHEGPWPRSRTAARSRRCSPCAPRSG